MITRLTRAIGETWARSSPSRRTVPETRFSRPCDGTVRLDGGQIGSLAPHQRARLGCVRTRQGTDLFDDLDVRKILRVASARDRGAAGLGLQESRQLASRLRELTDQGQSTLLIDHDTGLVLGICDRLVVLEFGRVIADGAPQSVREDPAVIAAYLGTRTSAPALVDRRS